MSDYEGVFCRIRNYDNYGNDLFFEKKFCKNSRNRNKKRWHFVLNQIFLRLIGWSSQSFALEYITRIELNAAIGVLTIRKQFYEYESYSKISDWTEMCDIFSVSFNCSYFEALNITFIKIHHTLKNIKYSIRFIDDAEKMSRPFKSMHWLKVTSQFESDIINQPVRVNFIDQQVDQVIVEDSDEEEEEIVGEDREKKELSFLNRDEKYKRENNACVEIEFLQGNLGKSSRRDCYLIQFNYEIYPIIHKVMLLKLDLMKEE